MPTVKHQIDVQNLWVEYEKIAMHFNDLLMRLRTQSLAGIAAVSTLVGIFSKTENTTGAQFDWLIAQALFFAMGFFWIAIWCLDMLYYNRLLSGAVNALQKLEPQTKPGVTFDGEINMSTLIEEEFSAWAWNLKRPRYKGVVAFYVIVFFAIVLGILFSAHMRGQIDLAALLPCLFSK
jgi:hypothetical protein